MKRFVTLSLVLVFLVGFCSSAQASLYLYSGRYRFDVNVRNQWYKDVNRATGYANVMGSNAQIQAEAPGYRRSSTTVFLTPNVTSYRVDVRLEETFVTADIVNKNGQIVPQSYTNVFSQNMYWGDEYGVRGTLPKANFSKLTERDIEVRVNGLWAFSPRIYLYGSQDRWDFEIVFRRDDMNNYSNRIQIITPSDDQLPALRADKKVDAAALAKDYLTNQQSLAALKGEAMELVSNRLISLARQIRRAYSTMSAEEKQSLLKAVPADSALAKELANLESFKNLHK